MFANGSTTTECASAVARGVAVISFRSRTMSKLQASNSATGNPSINNMVVNVTVQSGNFSAGRTTEATSSISQATTA